MQYEDQQEPTRDPHGGRASWFARWLTDSQVLQGIEEASKSRNPNRKFVVLQVLEGARIRAEKGLPPYGDLREKPSASGRPRFTRRIGAAADLSRNQRIRPAGKFARSQKLFDYLSGKELPPIPGCGTRSRNCARKSRQFRQALSRDLGISIPGRNGTKGLPQRTREPLQNLQEGGNSLLSHRRKMRGRNEHMIEPPARTTSATPQPTICTSSTRIRDVGHLLRHLRGGGRVH